MKEEKRKGCVKRKKESDEYDASVSGIFKKVRVYREGEERHISNQREGGGDDQARDSVAGAVSVIHLKSVFGIQYQVEQG